MSCSNYNASPITRPKTRRSASILRNEWSKKNIPTDDKSPSPCNDIKNEPFSDINTVNSTEFLETLNLKSKEKTVQNIGIHFDSKVVPEHTLINISPLCQFEEKKCNENLSVNALLETPVTSSMDPIQLSPKESQDSLGKTLAYSLQLIAAGDANIMPQFPSMSGDVCHSSPITFSPKEPKNETTHDSVEETIVLKEENTPPRCRYMTRSSLSYSDNQVITLCKRDQNPTVHDSGDLIVSENHELTAPNGQDLKEEKEQPIVAKKRGRRKKENGSCSISKGNVYICNQCGKAFNKSQTLRQHFITHTDRFACSFCNVRCKSKGDLRSHTQTHTKEKPFRCEVCNTFYTRESILRKHKLTQLHKNACFQLGNQIHMALKGDLDVCEGRSSKRKKLLCKQCPKVFLSKQSLKQHLKMHNYKFPCPHCQKRCKTALTLKIHKKCHLQMDSVPCKFCSRVFTNSQLQRDHIKTAHAFLTWKRKFPGNLWKTLLAQKVDYIDDLRAEICQSVSLEGKLICAVCSKNFKSKKAYEKHCAKHTKPCSVSTAENGLGDESTGRKMPKYHCSECTKSFTFFDEYSKHHADRHSDKPMTCHICYSQFSSTTEFKSHVQNHGPTMLFSGASLEETKIPHLYKRNKHTNGSHSEWDEKHGKTMIKAADCQLAEESDDESFFESRDFANVLLAVLKDCSDEEKEDETVCDDDEDEDDDDDDELYTGIRMLLLDSMQDCGGNAEKGSSGKRDYTTVKKHKVDFKLFCVQDDESSFYKCTPCDILFILKAQLQDHMKSHVCEYCNVFCQTKESLTEHFHCQEKEFKPESMKNGTKKTDLDEMSEIPSEEAAFISDDEMNEVFLDEMEGILDYESKSAPSMDFLSTFSHDEIIRTNKKIFDRYSCIDVPTNIYACTICKRKYARPTTLTRHFKTHVCHYCNTFFVDKSDLTDHKYKHRKKAAMIKAEISGESSSKVLHSPLVSKINRDLFKKFTVIDSTRNMNKCCLCDKLFVRKTVLTRHMKTHVCSYCDKFYEDKYELARHVNLHKMDSRIAEDDSANRQFSVYDEEKPFVTNSAFSNQLEEEGKMVSIGSYSSSALPQFSTAFSTQSTNSHETVTFIQIPVSETCADPTSVTYGPDVAADASTYQIISDPIVPNQGSYIVGPQNCHGDDSSKILTLTQDHIVAGDTCPVETTDLFECNICSKTFFKSGHLKSHISTHTTSGPYACRYCGKTFIRNGPLRKHEKTHDVKRCDHCDLNFTCQFELDHHMQIHGSYPFYK